MQFIFWKDMKLSIITCTYNSEKYLSHCIDSIIKQNIEPNYFEHIFVDGESTDRTIKIIQKYQSDYPSYNIRVISSKPRWVYNAMNIGTREASWEYIYLLNSDDYIYQNWLVDILNYATKSKIDFCFWNTLYVDEFWNNTWILKPNTLLISLFYFWYHRLWLYLYHYCCPQSVVYKRKIHESIWYYNEQFRLLSDREYNIKTFSTNFKIKYLNTNVSCFRIHEWSVTSNKKNMELLYKEWKIIWNLYFWYPFGSIRVLIVKMIRFLFFRN